jgi:prevent-host-death family protein
MIRKQVYIEKRHDQMLKRRASQRGVTEAELIREALDGVEIGAGVRRREVDGSAASKALIFMHSLSVEETMNVAEAKKQFSNLLGRVALGRETILIMRRGRPIARLIPPESYPPESGLGAVRGWLSDDDPFLAAVEEIVSARVKHRPRSLKQRRTSSKR